MPRLQLSFHGTFALKRQDILKVLVAANEEQGLKDSVENLSSRTGLGLEKVLRIVSWARRSGLVEGRHLTSEGKIVLKLDPYMDSLASQNLMHFYLSFGGYGLQAPPASPELWGGWSYFVYDFLCKTDEFTFNDLIHKSSLIFKYEKIKSIQSNFRILLRAYTEPQGLSDCRFLNLTAKDTYRKGVLNLANPWMLAYYISSLWERDFKNHKSVSIQTLIDQEMGCATLLGVSSSDLFCKLEILKEIGVVDFSKSDSDVIYRRWESKLNFLSQSLEKKQSKFSGLDKVKVIAMSDLQLSFHTTFLPKKQDLKSILKIASSQNGLPRNSEELQDLTGLGNKKAGPMKSWAIRSGLISNNKVSTVGKLVWEYDADLINPVTDWLMHFYLSLGTQGQKTYKGLGDTLEPAPSTIADWGGWTYFIYEFLPQYSSFTLPQLVQHSASIFPQETEKRLTENFRMVLKTYILAPNRSELSPLRSTQFLSVSGDQFSIGQSNLPNPYLVGYFLAQLWQRDFGQKTSVLSTDIFDQPLGLAALLGISTEKLQTCLNQLETHAIIEQRRTVSPAQIIRRWEEPLTLLSKAYSIG